MLGWAIFFFLLAIVAAFFGFGGVAAIAVDAAKILFVVFVILFVLTLVVHLVRGRGSPPLCVGRSGRSEEHTSELQSLMRISYVVFCLKKKNFHLSLFPLPSYFKLHFFSDTTVHIT